MDANAKQMIRELNASIRALGDAEQLRRETESALIRKKFGNAFGVLGSWASGGAASHKSPEHVAVETQALQVEIHRDGVMWLLQQRLGVCCRTQQDMMEARLAREMEKNRAMLSAPAGDFAEFLPTTSEPPARQDTASEDGPGAGQGLTEEQMQMFEEGNQDMMKHYEGTLDKVRYVLCPSLRSACALHLLHAHWRHVATSRGADGEHQNGGEITGGDFGAAVAAGEQPHDAVSPHRAAGGRLVLDDGKRRGRQQGAPEGDATAQCGTVHVFRGEWPVRVSHLVGLGNLGWLRDIQLREAGMRWLSRGGRWPICGSAGKVWRHVKAHIKGRIFQEEGDGGGGQRPRLPACAWTAWRRGCVRSDGRSLRCRSDASAMQP